MGVLACDRRGCENIMSDYYSPACGYLCRECYSELLEKCPEISIEEFMKKYKVCDYTEHHKLHVQNEFRSVYGED